MSLSNETKVGLLVVVALAGLAWLSFRSGSFGAGLATPSRELSTSFRDVDGLKIGSAVKMAGVEVGEVTEIVLSPGGVATLKLNVRKDVKLPSDVTAQIATSGLIGERYLALVPGTDSASGAAVPLLADTVKTIPSGSAARVENIGQNFAKVSDDLEAMTASLRGVLGNPENAQKIQTIIDGMSTFSGSLQNDSAEIIANLREASASLKTILGGNEQQTGQMIQNFSEVAANMARITERLEKGEGPLGQLLMGDVSGTGNLMADLQASARDFRTLMEKINKGEGTIGKLVNDPETADKLNQALDSFGDVAQRIEQFKTEVAFEGRSLMSEDSVSKGEFSLMLQPRPTRFYLAGVTADGFASRADDVNDPSNPYFGRDFGDDLKFTLQFGHVYQNVPYLNRDVAVRIGMKDSTAGLGVDTYGVVPFTDKNYKLSADLYDFGGSEMPNADNPHLDLTARVDLLGKTIYGVAGYDNVLNKEYGSPMIGVGMRFQDDDLKYVLGQAL